MQMDGESGGCMHTIHKYPALVCQNLKGKKEIRVLGWKDIENWNQICAEFCILHFAKLSFNSIMLIYTEILIILRWNGIYSPH